MTTSNYPVGYGPTAPPPTNGQMQISFHTVLIALRCWWHIAVPTGLLLASGAAVIVFYVTKPTYTALSSIEIHQRPISLMPGAAAEDSQRFVANQIALMKSRLVLEPVTALKAVRSAPEFIGEEDLVLYLRNHLRVRNQEGSDVFEIEFTSQDPVKAALIVEEVVKSYFALHDRHESKLAQLKIELLSAQERSQEVEVRRLSDDIKSLSAQLGESEPFQVRGSSSRGSKDEPASSSRYLESQLHEAKLAQLTLDVEVQAEKDLLARETFAPPPDKVAEFVDADPKVANLKAGLVADRATLDQHKERSVNLEKNTVYQRLQEKVKSDEAALEKLLTERRLAVAADLERFARDKRQTQIDKLEAERVRVATKVAFLNEQLDAEQKDQVQVAGDRVQLVLAWTAYERESKLLDAISTRIMALKIEDQAPPRVKPFDSATVPTRPDEELPIKKMIMAALVALVIPLGMAVGIEVLFCRVASRQQLESYGKIAVVGEVTTLPRRLRSQTRDAAPHRDVQLFEESINGLRTYLTLIESTRGRRVLAVTSSISREGKTSLAAQLAVSVASSTGKSTLLIDGDMRAPDIHRIFEVDCGPGLADVLAGKCPIEEAIETEFNSRLHLLTAGRLSASPHLLTGGGEFAALIEKLRGMYEHIIIDTPPILAASEALVMSGAADAAILCVRRDFSRLDQVSEATSRLLASGVKVAGAVLNGVPTQHYAYRYGAYYYQKDRAEVVPATEITEPRAAGSSIAT